MNKDLTDKQSSILIDLLVEKVDTLQKIVDGLLDTQKTLFELKKSHEDQIHWLKMIISKQAPVPEKKRGLGRPKGSKNKRKGAK